MDPSWGRWKSNGVGYLAPRIEAVAAYNGCLLRLQRGLLGDGLGKDLDSSYSTFSIPVYLGQARLLLISISGSGTQESVFFNVFTVDF